jgi:hypothetical protein
MPNPEVENHTPQPFLTLELTREERDLLERVIHAYSWQHPIDEGLATILFKLRAG